MSLKDRIAHLEERERRLLGVLVVVFVVFVLLLVPLGVTALLGSKRSRSEALREAIEAIERDRNAVDKAKAEREAVLERYAQPSPALAGLLAKMAEQSKIEIPESVDRDAVPHGKKYEERSTRIVLRRVGMLALARFMERIEQAPYPLRILRVNIRKRGTQPDSFDVEMVVSAFDRKAPQPKGEGAEAEGRGAEPGEEGG